LRRSTQFALLVVILSGWRRIRSQLSLINILKLLSELLLQQQALEFSQAMSPSGAGSLRRCQLIEHDSVVLYVVVAGSVAQDASAPKSTKLLFLLRWGS
jgi:hypothetical protein